MAIKSGWRGRTFEDFAVGDIYPHPLGRTITDVDNIWFTLSANMGETLTPPEFNNGGRCF